MKFTQLASSSKGNLYTLGTKGSALLLEAGVSMNTIRNKLFENCDTLSLFDGCLITHEHSDHAMAAKSLIDEGVPVYCSRGTAEAIGCTPTEYLQAGKAVKVGNFIVKPFAISHDAAEPLGFLIGSAGDRLLFATDTHYIHYTFSDLTIIAIECNYSKESITSIDPLHMERVQATHMSLDTVIEFLKANDLKRVREIHLLHLSDDNSNAVAFKQTIERLTGIPTIII